MIYVDFHDAFYICTRKFMNRVLRQKSGYFLVWNIFQGQKLINYKVGYSFFVDTHCTGGDLNAM